MDSKRQDHELLGSNANLTFSAVCIRLHRSPCCPYCKPTLRGWKIITFKKRQIISPQNQNGSITVSNSYTNLFWNNFSAAKINMPFRKVLFVDHWLQNCYYVHQSFPPTFKSIMIRPFSAKKSSDNCLRSLSLGQCWQEDTVWRGEILSLVGEKFKYKSYRNMWWKHNSSRTKLCF